MFLVYTGLMIVMLIIVFAVDATLGIGLTVALIMAMLLKIIDVLNNISDRLEKGERAAGETGEYISEQSD